MGIVASPRETETEFPCEMRMQRGLRDKLMTTDS
jgi:hypothetical protein